MITLADIVAARDRIAGGIYESPCVESIPLSQLTGARIYCKLDYLQRTGSFKERGARNALLQLSNEQRKRGVIAASAGNHAQGVAYHGGLLGIPTTVVMPKFAALVKVTNCRHFGAKVVLHGADLTEARAHAGELAQRDGLTFIHPFDNADVIAGQGTIALEILEQTPDDEASLALAILRLAELEKSVVEGAGAAPLAAFIAGQLDSLKGKRVVLVLAGGNIDSTMLGRVIEVGLVADGRLCRFTVTISDRPGGLARLAELIASTGASIREIVHDRAFSGPDLSAVRVVCDVETTGHAHARELRATLTAAGLGVADAQ